MYRARDRVEQAPWLAELERAAADLGIGDEARSFAADIYLSSVPAADRSKPAAIAAALYAGALIAGEERAQTAVASAVGVSRLSVQSRWKPALRSAGFEPPDW